MAAERESLLAKGGGTKLQAAWRQPDYALLPGDCQA